MLYEMIGIVRPGNILEVKEICKTAGSMVLRGGGVVRGITNWGIFYLPKPKSFHGTKYHRGHYFIMRFDSSAQVQTSVRRALGLDPRLMRCAMVKMGTTLEEIKDVAGKAEWPMKENIVDIEWQNRAGR